MIRPEAIEGVSDALSDIGAALADPQRLIRFEAFFPKVSGTDTRVCNLVLQGGGMLGAAHVGFLYGLESTGVRFAGVAGASAGSIVAMGLVCARGDDIARPTAENLFKLVCSVPTDIFIDGPRPIRRLIKSFLRQEKLLTPSQLPSLRAAWLRMLKRRGLNPGFEFENWLSQMLSRDFGVGTTVDLLALLDAVRLKLGPNAPTQADGMLKLMSTSVPVGMKLEFPADLKLLDPQYKWASPALLVRCSMSIPVFFDPVELRTLPETWSAEVEARYITLAEGGELKDLQDLKDIYMLDGGVFSNLPLDAFANWPDMPTVAVALVTKPPQMRSLGYASFRSLASEALGVFTAMKAQRDRDAFASIRTNWPQIAHRLRLVGINTGDHNWLNFMAGQEDLNDLFARGVKTAAKFIATI